MTMIPAPAEPSIRRAWYAVGFLMLLYCLSYVDRYALALLAAPISSSLHIPDVKIGVLFGAGFGVVYALTGLPLAHLIDRGGRIRLVAVGVILWTASTVLSGFASGFVPLLLCRSGVAVGEAVLSPAAISLIGDLFVREKRTLPTSCYVAIAGFMQAGAYVVCGLAIAAADRLSASTHIESWRLTLILLGAPGLILGPLFLVTVREPRRRREIDDYTSLRQAVSYISHEFALFGWIFLAMSAMGTCGAAFLAWAPSLLIRAFDQSAATTGYLFGTIGVIAALIGALTWPSLVGLANRARWRDAPILLLAGGLGIAIAGIWVVGASSSLPIALAAIGVAMFGVSASGILPPLIVQIVAPSRMRGRLTAIILMASTLIGLPLGPPLAAALAGAFFSGPHAIGLAITAIASVCGPVAVIASLLARRRFAIAVSAAEARESSALAAIDSVAATATLFGTPRRDLRHNV